MVVSEKGLNIIKEFEGYKDKAYKCPAGVWTIGWGTTRYPNGLAVRKGDTCTPQQAHTWLAFEVGEDCARLNKIIEEISLELSQNQFDALCSFFYNLGIGKVERGTTMGNAIHSKQISAIADAFLVYNKISGLFGIKKVSKGLDRRRKLERELFLT